MRALGNGTDRSGQTGAANTIKEVAPTNRDRRGLTFQNVSDADMWLTQTDIDPAVDVGFKLVPYQGMEMSTSQSVRVFSTGANKKFAATET